MEENKNPNNIQQQNYSRNNQQFDNNSDHHYLNDTGFEEPSYVEPAAQATNSNLMHNSTGNAMQEDVAMEEDGEDDFDYGEDEDLDDDIDQLQNSAYDQSNAPVTATNAAPFGSIKISIPFFSSSAQAQSKAESLVVNQPIIQPQNPPMQQLHQIQQEDKTQGLGSTEPSLKFKISLNVPQQPHQVNILQTQLGQEMQFPLKKPLGNVNVAPKQELKPIEQTAQINPPSGAPSQSIKIVLGGLRPSMVQPPAYQQQVPPYQQTLPQQMQIPFIQEPIQQPGEIKIFEAQPIVQAPPYVQDQSMIQEQLLPQQFSSMPQQQAEKEFRGQQLPFMQFQPQLEPINLAKTQQEFQVLPISQQQQYPLYPTQQLSVQPDISIPIQSFQVPLAAPYQEFQAQPIEDTQMLQQEVQAAQPAKKREKKEKKKKIKEKLDLRQFYEATKTKVTLEIDTVEKRARGQSVYILKLKSEEELNPILDELKSKDIYKKIQLFMRFHSKQLDIGKISILRKENKDENISMSQASPLEDLGFDYALPQTEQVKIQRDKFQNISRDLFTLEANQTLMYDQEYDSPLILVHNIQSLSFKKDNLYQQLDKEVRVVIQFYINTIYDFGIHSVNYKKFDNLGALNSLDSTGTYFHTSDRYDTQCLWMPLIHGTQNYPMDWSFKYIVPSQYQVVSTGQLFIKQVEQHNESNPRALFHYKIKDQEKAPASKIGFIIGQFPHIHKLTEVPKIKSAYSFFVNHGKYNLFNQQNKFYEKNITAVINELQRLLNAQYPFQTLKLVFVPNLFLRNSRKQSIDFSGGLHILDEELLFPKNQQDARYKTYKYLASSLSFDFFGGVVYEQSPEDFWLLQGIRENIGNHYKITKFGNLLHRYHIMQTIESVYQKAKHGIERYPLNTYDIPNPQEFMLNELLYEKSELVMHMIESMIDKVYFERIIRELYHQSRPFVQASVFSKIFKQVCGFKLKQFANNWINSTSCPKLTVQYVYNKKNNSLDLKLTQQSAMRDYFVFSKYIQDNIDLGDLLAKPFTLKDPLNLIGDKETLKSSLKQIEAMGKFMVDIKRSSTRWFEGEVNVMLYLTDGADISTQQQKMSLKMGENEVTINIPLSVKVKKTIQNKKKEYETMQMYEHHHHQNNSHRNEDDEDEGSMDNKHSKGPAGAHLIDNNQWKFGLNDLELEDYPIETKNIFEVKNLESSVLWIRVDPDMEYIRKVSVKQEHNNWLFQLLLEKDIIGQIEAIKQLYKLSTQQQFVYKILQSVSTNEVYYFKVRKVALKYLQKMQTSLFNQYLSHEKFLIKIFNQRNFDENIGFYKSNDFSKVMEYFFDKYLLKTLSKCKEVPLAIRDEVKEIVANFSKAMTPQILPQTTTEGGSIQISLAPETTSLKGLQAPREHLLMVSSDSIAQLLLKLLQENDNSENFYDDSSYLKTIIKAMGSLDSFKFMPEIANEIHRQFKLDHIGKFSPQFAITIGSISGYFNIRKQIYLFKFEKLKYIEQTKEDIEFYQKQIYQSETTLNQMEIELESILQDDKWPLEVRFFIGRYRVKHSFLYQDNNFMKALYIQLKVIDNFIAVKKIRDSVEYLRILVLFLEQKIDRLDWRECLLDNQRSKAINSILWDMICLPFHYLDNSILYWLKRLYSFLYGNNIPQFLIKSQNVQGIKPEIPEIDDIWANDRAIGMNDNGNSMMPNGITIREMHAKSRSQKFNNKTIGGTQKLQIQQKIDNIMQKVGDIIPGGLKLDKVDIKLRIVTQPDNIKQQTVLKGLNDQQAIEKPTWVQPQKQQSGFKITLGQLDPTKVLYPTSSAIQIPGYQPSSSLIQIGMSKQTSQKTQSQGIISLKNPSYHSEIMQTGFDINQNSLQAFDNDQQSQLMLLKSISYGQGEEMKNGDKNERDIDMQGDEDSHTYDEFAEISFAVDWVQRIWDITGHLWYHEESQAFMEPITIDTFGGNEDLYQQYLNIVDYPIDIFTIKENIKKQKYKSVGDWYRDVLTMFQNCYNYNEDISEIYKSAKKLERFFNNELRDYGIADIINQNAKVRIR